MNNIAMRYEDIQVDTVYEFMRTITEEDGRTFAQLSGDSSILPASVFGTKYQPGKNVVHGMLAVSLFSTLIDVHGPGPKSLYVSQTFEFRKPIFYGDRVKVRGIVCEKSDAIRVVTLTTEILRGDEVMVSGEAKVKV